jgi:transposase
LAQQLVAAGETVLDVPPTLSARVRLLDSTRTDKTDSHDARAAAIVAMRHGRLRRVTPVVHPAVLRLLADRHHDLTGLRTQAICRLHALLCQLTPGGASGRLFSPAGWADPAWHRSARARRAERKRIALDLLGDVRRFDSQLVALNERIAQAVLASGTTLTDVHGVGALGAAIILGHTPDITRFPDAGHFARYNATAPIAASSALKDRHRLNPRGNRQLNRAIHVAAVTQIAHDTDGRIYYRRKPETATKACQPAATSQRRIAGMTGNATEIWSRPQRSIRARQNAVEPCVCHRLSARCTRHMACRCCSARRFTAVLPHARSSSSSPPVRPWTGR